MKQPASLKIDKPKNKCSFNDPTCVHPWCNLSHGKKADDCKPRPLAVALTGIESKDDERDKAWDDFVRELVHELN
jgi:hypothetical protein